MPSPRRPDVDAITVAEAAPILALGVSSVWRLIRAGELDVHGERNARYRLSRAQVEQLALQRWRPKPVHPDSYWVSTREAARILGVIPTRVRQLADAGLLPFEWTPRGARLYRRAQIEVVANARRVRFHSPPGGEGFAVQEP